MAIKTRSTRFCSVMLLLFFLPAWIVSSNRAVIDLLTPAFGLLVILIGTVVAPIALFFAFRARPGRHTHLSLRMKNYLRCGLVLVVALVAYGYMAGNTYQIIAKDLFALAPILGGLVLGTDDEVWDLLTPGVWTLTALAIILCLTLTDSGIVYNRSIINEETGTAFETHLTVLPILAAVHACRRRSNWYFPMAFGCLGILFIYLFLGRRGVTLRAALEVVVVCVVAPLLARTSHRLIVSCLAVMLFMIGLLLYFPFDTLLERYRGRAGVITTVTVENERFEEGSILWDDLNAAEIVFGRGIGGAYSIDTNHGYAMDILDGDQTGKTGTHAGAFWPLLKGGLFFVIFYFVPCMFLFRGLAFFRQLDPITQGTVLVAPVWFAFQFVDGSMSHSQPWMGFGTGLLLSRFDRIGVNVRIPVVGRLLQPVRQPPALDLATPAGAAR